MGQLQDHFADQITQLASTSAENSRAIVQVGGMLGIAASDAIENQPQTILLDVRSHSVQGVSDEIWHLGDLLYLNEAASVVTLQPAGPFLGWASMNGTPAVDGIVKPAGQVDGEVSTKAARADGGSSVISYLFDFAAFPLQAVQGVYTLRAALPANTWISRVDFIHDGNLLPVTAELALGTTLLPASILASTALSVLIALGVAHTRNEVVTANVVVAADVLLTIGVADIAAGKFVLELHTSPI